MVYDQAQSPRLGQRTPVESTYVRMFAGAEIPEAAWPGQLIFRIDEQILQVFDGDAWQDVTGGQAGQLTFVGPVPPVAQSIGDVWYNTSDSNRQYVAKSVGADQIAVGEWEVVSGAVPPITPTTQIYHQNTAPGSGSTPPPKYADFWYQTPGNNQYYYDPAAPSNHWVFVQDTGIPAAQSTADGAQSTANSANAAAAAAQGTANTATTNANTAIANASTAQATADGKVRSFFQTSAPGGLVPGDVGDMWFDTDDGNKLYQWTGTQWSIAQDQSIAVAQSAANAANTAAGNAQSTANSRITTFYVGTPFPVSLAIGDLWVKTDAGNALYRAASIGANTIAAGKWVSVQDTAISTAASAAAAANTAATDAMNAATAAQATADGAVTTYYQTTAPWANGSSGHANNAGDMWFNTTTGQAYRWNDSTKNWDVIQDQAIGQALAAAQNAQTTADGKITAWYGTSKPWADSLATHDLDFGDIWYDTGNKNKPWYWANNRTWTVVQDGTIADAQNTANTAVGKADTAQATAITKVKSFYQTSPPTSLADGDIWFDTDDGYKQYRAQGVGANSIVTSGTGWYLVQDALIPQAVTTANGKNTIYYNNLAPTVAVPGPSFVVNDMWFDLDNGYAISLWDGQSWVPRPLGGTALDADSITAREIASSYVYAGMVKADNIDTGTLTSGIVLGALIETPTTVQGGRVEIDPAGIRIIGHDDTTTLQPDLSEFKGQAEVTNLTVKGTATLRSTTNELSRGATVTMVNGVTAPGSAPSYNIDYQQLQLTGAPLGAIGVGLQWDAASSRWWVASKYNGGSGGIVSYDATGAFQGTMGSSWTPNIWNGTAWVAGTIRTGCRIGTKNYYLADAGGGAFYIGGDDVMVKFFPISTSSSFAMTYDGTYLVVGEYYLNASSPKVRCHRFYVNATQGAELIPNGTFEVNTSGWTYNNMNPIVSGAQPIAGTKSAQFLTDGTVPAGTCYMKTAALACSQMTAYTFSAKAIRSGTVGGTITCKLDWQNAAGTVLQTDTSYIFTQNPGPSVETCLLQATSPLLATKVVVTMTMPKVDDTLKVDAITLTSNAGLNFFRSLNTTDDIAINSTTNALVKAMYVGNGDFGAKTWVIASTATAGYVNLACPDNGISTAENITLGWPQPGNTLPFGIGYDGSNFWELGSANVLYKYEANPISGNKSWQAGYTWLDTTNNYETPVSPPVPFTMKSRGRLTITGAALNVTAGGGDPNAIGIYLVSGSAAPARTDWHYQGQTVTGSLVVPPPIVFAGRNPPATSNFPVSSPAVFQSSASDAGGKMITLRGDGSGRIGQASWNAAGTWVGIGGGGTAGGPADTYTAQATAALTLTNVDADITGMSVPVSVLDPNDRFLVIAAVDFRATTSTSVVDSAMAVGKLLVDGVIQPGQAVFNSGSTTSVRATVHQNWVITGMSAGSHTVKMTASENATSGSITLGASHTKMAIVKLVAVKGDQGVKGDKGDTGAQGAQGVIGPTGNTGSQGPIGGVGPQGPIGNTGLQGPIGNTGSQGPQGNQGVQGTAGEKWFSQSGAPASGTGAIADWSLDTVTGDIYEKTAATVWTLRGNIRGPQGAQGPIGNTGSQGPAGNTGSQGPIGNTGAQGPQGNTGATGQAEAWWSGPGAPGGDTGAVGDWYLDTTGGFVYEKTGASAWTQRANITGPQGIQGIQGQTGSQGQIGGTGAAGPQGIQGPKGDKGDPGSTGAQGPPGAGGGSSMAIVDETTTVVPLATQMTFRGSAIAAVAGAAGEAVVTVTVPSTLPPSGAAGGDLGGTYPNPTVPGMAKQTWVTSRAENLVTNGTALLGDNTNFPTLTFYGADAPIGSVASFRSTAALNGTALSTELVPVDPSKPMRLSVDVKQTVPGATGSAYIGIAPYDAAGLAISPYSYMRQAGTTTTLASTLNPGDTVLRLTSAASWNNAAGGNTWLRTLTFWDYVDSFGHAWPTETYTRNYYPDAYADGAISGNNITLRVPWAGPSKPAGTPLSNGSAGGTYMYADIQAIPESWKTLTGVFQGVHSNLAAAATLAYPQGTAQAKLALLFNYSSAGGSQLAFANIKFGYDLAVSNDARFTDARTPVAHTHVKANITDFAHAHAIADLPVAPSGTSNTTQVVRADDARLSDARTPSAHTHTKANITDLGTIGTAAAKDVPSSGNASTSQVVQGDDTRLTNSRTPTAHSSSHSQGQPDAISIAESQVQFLVADLASLNSGKAATAHTHAAADVSSGQLDTARLGTTPAVATYLKGAPSGQNATWVAPSQVKTDLALTKSDVALASVDNTSDATKPVSTPQQTALNGKANTSHSHAETDITNLTTDLAGKAAVGHTHTPAQVGLDQVNNTSDANKPVSTAQAAADSTVQSNAQTYANTAQSNAQAFATSANAVLLPAGSMTMYGGSAAPTGYLLCDGSSYSQTTYAALYAVIGRQFTPSTVGAGLFCVPDMQGRFPLGVNPGTSDSTFGVAGRNETQVGTAGAGGTAQQRADRLDHAHVHTTGPVNTGSTGGHTHEFGVNGATNTTTTGAGPRVVSVGGSSSPSFPNGVTTVTGSGHSHTVVGNTDSSGVGGANYSNHPLLTVNFIIKT